MSGYDLMVQDTTQALVRSGEFTELVMEVARLGQFVPSVRVQDEESNTLANEVLVRVKKAKKRLEEMRKVTKAPFMAFGQSVDNVFRPLADKCGAMITQLDEQMVPYAREAMRRVEEARLAGQLAAQELAGDGPVSPLPGILPPVVKSDSGTTRIVKRWAFEVVDVVKVIKAAMDSRTKVTMDVVMVNEVRLRELVESGGWSVGQWEKWGVKVWREDRQRTVVER